VYTAAALILPLIASASRVRADIIYGYTQIGAEGKQTFPAINNSGVVAYQGAVGVFSGNGGTLTRIGQGAAGGFNVWINDSGQVAFVNNPSLGVFSVSLGTGGPLTVIHTYSIAAPHEIVYGLPVVANNGTVTYLSNDTGFFSGTGGPVTTVHSIPGTSSGQYSADLKAWPSATMVPSPMKPTPAPIPFPGNKLSSIAPASKRLLPRHFL
jgi:hypothetical protein